MSKTATKSLRSHRLSSPLDPEAQAFLDSTTEDAALLRDDILGTLAHLAVLEGARILSNDESGTLRGALTELYRQASGFRLDPHLEDVHMNVESWLTQRVGDLGKKVHTGRSRNDQVALDLRLWARRQVVLLALEVHHLSGSLLGQAEAHPDAVMPGHTHFQVGQPVLLSHTLGAHAARLARDLHRLQNAYVRLNVSPLGAGALAGTSHPIDPAVSASLLGFDAPFTNSLDAVSDRDFVHELLFGLALVLNHVSGLAEELILFTHPAFGFATIDDAHATGSSLMPQKKNPDVLEVARAKAATALGALASSLSMTKALPLAYNRDLQEQKRLVIDVVPQSIRAVRVVADLIERLTIHEEALLAAAGLGFSDATELADYLVRKGVPFRDAHAQAAQAVQSAIAKGTTLGGLTLADFKAVNPKIAADVQDVLGPTATVAAKTSPGGTAPEPAARAIEAVTQDLEERASFFYEAARSLAEIERRLVARAAGAKRRPT